MTFSLAVCRSIVFAKWATAGILFIMVIRPRIRPLVCMLLVVSTMISVAAPARACVCSIPTQTNSSLPNEPPTTAQMSAAPALKPCCNRPCCATKRDVASPGCCCEDPSRSDATGPNPKQGGSGQKDCGAPGCDCGVPAIPLTTHSPIPAASDATDFSDAVSLVPTIFLPSHVTATRTLIELTSRTSADLVISLSRLTC